MSAALSSRGMTSPTPVPSSTPVPRETIAHAATELGLVRSEVPARIGTRYEILGLLGTGGMGSVYRARDAELDEIVALKFLRRDLVASTALLERFRMEVKLARRVTHVNVARTFDIGEHGGERFLTMEYVDGHSLARVLVREGALAPQRACEIGLAIAAGLGAAHAAGVVHRDLKPDNVLLDQRGRVVLTDFGIARATFGGSATQPGGVVGTPAYMAPEQVEGLEVDARADLYAFGAVLYEMLTGVAPWRGDSAISVATARLVQPAPDPRRENGAVPDVLADIVLSCLARHREQRCASAEEAAAALVGARALLDDRGAAAPVPAAVRAYRVAPVPHLDDATVAVLPFRNAGAPEDDELAEDLTDDLVDALSMTRGVKVRPRRLTPRQPHDADLGAVGRALGAQVLVEGTIRRRGEQLRVSTRVLSVGEEIQLWAARFERTPRDVLAVSDEIARGIGAVLALDRDGRKRPSTPKAPLRRGAEGSDAVDAYLRARRALRDGWAGFGDLGRAVELFEEARSLSPNDPGVLSGLAMALARRFNYDVANEAALVTARAAASSAIASSSHSGEPWLAVATLDYVTGDWPAAVRALRVALDRAPGLLKAHEMLACIEGESGREEEAIVRLETVLSLDPSEVSPRWELARICALVGRWERAEQLLNLPTTDAPSALVQSIARARAELFRGEPRWERVTRDDVARNGRLALAFVCAKALHERALDASDFAVLERMAQDLPRRSRLRTLLLQVESELRAYTGDREGALVALEQAASANLFDRLWLDRSPVLVSIRSDARFAAVRARVDAVAQRIEAALSAPLDLT